MCSTYKCVLFLPTDCYFHVVIVTSAYAAPPPAAIDTNNVCPLPEPCYVHAGEHLSSSLCKKGEIQGVRHKTVFSLMAQGLWATYFHKRGVIKAALWSHLCSRQSTMKEEDLFGFIKLAWRG